MSRIRYKEIAAELERRIGRGEFPPGGVLPSESALGTEYSASRVTIRRALDQLRELGSVDSRQGFGWFVPAAPVAQPLGVLATIEAQLARAGRDDERQILAFGFGAPPDAVAAVLDVDEVLTVRRVNLADGEPFALVTVWCPAELGRSLSLDDVERSSFHELLPVEIVGAKQSIQAVAADSGAASHLGVPEGSPLLRCWRQTVGDGGAVVLVSEQLFPGHLTELTVDLTAGSGRGAATGPEQASFRLRGQP